MNGISQRIAQLPRLIGDTLAHPTSNLTATAVLFASIVLIALIGVVVLLVMALRSQGVQRGGETPLKTRGPRLDRSERRVVLAGALLALFAVATIFFVRAGQTATCLGCHAAASSPVKSAMTGTHRSARCWACHGGRGPFGETIARLQYLRWTGVLMPSDARRQTYVPRANCLVCHGDVATRMVTTDHVRMKHAEPLSQGWACITCHPDVGHEGPAAQRASRKFMMGECVICHDGNKARAECGTCHVDDVGVPGGTPPERFPKVELGPPKTCRGCHSIASCNQCHGLEMPHSEDFKKRGHAMQAAFEKKKVCWKCHTITTFCNRCHRFRPDGSTPHQVNFKRLHMSEPLDARCGCHPTQKAVDFCVVCHGRAPKPLPLPPAGIPSARTP